KILTAWNLDTFGQTIQMPQLFRRAGLHYFVFTRDLPPAIKDSARNLFYWQSPDGSKVLAQQSAYTIWYSPQATQFSSGLTQGLETLIRHNLEGNDRIMVLWGTDQYLQTETSQQIEKLIRQAASKSGIPIKAVLISTPSRYFVDVEKSGIPLPTYTYDFNPPL